LRDRYRKTTLRGVAVITIASVVMSSTGRTTMVARRAERRSAGRGAEVTSTITARPLTATDRCDRCGAQAYVRVVMSSGSELLFCAHHWRQNEDRLREIGVAIQDESERLASVPATAALEER
jgi:hypothetical protein